MYLIDWSPDYTVWRPFYQVHSDRIEQIQKIFEYDLCYLKNQCHYYNFMNLDCIITT